MLKMPAERNLRFEREKEKLKEVAAALDRDRNLMRCLGQPLKPPTPQHQASTPVRSNRSSLTLVDKPVQKKKEQRISTMSDTQILEKLSKIV